MKAMERKGGKVSKVILAALIAALIIGVTLSVLYFVYSFRYVNSSTTYVLDDGSFSNTGDHDQEIISIYIDQAIDGLLVNVLISEYQARNGGSYPSNRYLNEALSASGFTFSDRVEIKGEADDPSTTALPLYKEFHIWPDRSCSEPYNRSLLTGTIVNNPDEVSYGDLIVDARDGESDRARVLLRPEVINPDSFLDRYPLGVISLEWSVNCYS